MSHKVLTAENFDAEVSASGLVMVDFWAEWCGPCRMLAPVLDEVAAERSDVVIGKVDVDSEPDLARRFGINAIPTLLFFKNGQPAGMTQGYMDKSKLMSVIDEVAAK